MLEVHARILRMVSKPFGKGILRISHTNHTLIELRKENPFEHFVYPLSSCRKLSIFSFFVKKQLSLWGRFSVIRERKILLRSRVINCRCSQGDRVPLSSLNTLQPLWAVNPALGTENSTLYADSGYQIGKERKIKYKVVYLKRYNT